MERMGDLSGCCVGRAPVPAAARPLAGAGTAGDAHSASLAARPGARARQHKKRPAPRGRNAEPAGIGGREGPAEAPCEAQT